MKFDLADFVPYLLNRTGVCVAGAFARELKPHGLTIQKWRILAALCHAPDQRIGQIADLTSIDIWTVSRLANGLERQGLVERGRTGDDGRGVVVALSPRGHEVTRVLVPLALEYEDLMLTGFTPDEVDSFKRMLIRAYDNLGLTADREAAPAEPAVAEPPTRDGIPGHQRQIPTI